MAYTTINKSSDYFNTLLWSGDGTTSNSITGAGFQPDFVWIKRRNAVAGHKLNDSVRGVNKQLTTNNTNAEGTDTNQLTSFDSDGFTLSNNADVNNSSGTYVGWNWLAGGTASSNTDGSITSQVSANTTSGFSIVSYTGTGANATVGHGLGVAPSYVIVKARSTTGGWITWVKGFSGTQYLTMQTTNAVATSADIWNSTVPSTDVFSIGTNSSMNTSSATYIAYCFADVKGFSKFGSYTGNGSTDGPFIYTGFKPAWFLVKQSSASGQHWYLFDNKRDTFNAVTRQLYPSLSNAESNDTSAPIDFTSNGVKIRNTSGHDNTSGATYIYMAFAENPLVTTGKVPATAR